MEVTIAATKFTWRGPKWNGRDWVFNRLDRFLCNVEWRLRFQEGFGRVLPRVQSDHHPIMILTEGEPNISMNRPFRFEAIWTTHPDFHRFLKDKWGRDNNLVLQLHNLTPLLKEWNNDTFGNIFKRKRELLARLNGILNSYSYGYSVFRYA